MDEPNNHNDTLRASCTRHCAYLLVGQAVVECYQAPLRARDEQHRKPRHRVFILLLLDGLTRTDLDALPWVRRRGRRGNGTFAPFPDDFINNLQGFYKSLILCRYFIMRGPVSASETPSRRTSGSRETLRPPRPLRTGRADFPASGSSLCQTPTL